MSEDTEVILDTPDSVGFDDDISGIDIPGFDEPKTEETPAEASEDVQSAEAATESDEPTTAEKAAGVKATDTPAQVTAKILKFKAGEKAVELSEDATVDWRVDGKVVPIRTRDLLDNYAGKIAWERKNQENANDRKALEATRQTQSAAQERTKSLVTNMYEKTRQGKMLEAVSDLVELTGIKVDAREYIKNLRTGLMEQAKTLSAMTPEQQKIYEMEEDREYLKSKYERLHQQTTQEQAQKASLERMATVAEQNKIPYDTFAQHTEFLRQHARAQKQDPALITPEFVVGYMGKLKSYEMARDAIAAVEPALRVGDKITDEARWDALAKLAEAHKDTVSTEEFIELYKQTRQKKQASDVAKKLEKQPRSTAAKASTRQPKDLLAEASDFSKFSKDDARW